MSHRTIRTDRQEGLQVVGVYNSQHNLNRTAGMAMMGMHLSSIVESSIRAILGRVGVGVLPGGDMLAGVEAGASRLIIVIFGKQLAH